MRVGDTWIVRRLWRNGRSTVANLVCETDVYMEVIVYDDAGFPSGTAGGSMEVLYLEHTRKRLDKIEKRVQGRMGYRDLIPRGVLMSAVAMHAETLERVDLRPFIQGTELYWPAPPGTWKVMYFVMVPDVTHMPHRQTDYMDPEAVDTDVLLRGAFELEIWDPHTGTIAEAAGSEMVREQGEACPRFHLTLPPVRSLFVITVDSTH